MEGDLDLGSGAKDIRRIELPEPPLGSAVHQGSTSWSRWYEKDQTTSLLEPADKVCESKDQFLQVAELSSEERKILEQTTTIDDFITITDKAQESWKRLKHVKTRNAIQKTVSDWSQLAESYKSTVEALKSARPEFGAVAWGTIGLVVTIIVNKQKKEEALDESIRKISQSLPRLDFYCMLYPTRRMQECVADLYAKVMEFLQKAYIYYKRSGWRRVLSAMIDPVEVTIQPIVNEIAALSQTIKDEGTIALAAEIRDVRETVNKVKTTLCGVESKAERIGRDLDKTASQVNELKDIIEDSEMLLARDDLRTIKHIFADKNYDPNREYQSVKDVLAAIPRKTAEIFYCMRLRDHDIIREWPHKIIWLSRFSGGSGPPVWLSNFAIERCEHLRSTEPQLVIYSSCLHGAHPSSSVKLLLKYFIYQILFWKPQLLRNRKDLEEFRNSDIEMTLGQLWDLASNLIPSDIRVFWIIDRIDQCKFARGEERFEKVFERLKTLVQHQRELKIFVTSICPPAALVKIVGEELDSKEVYELVGEI